MSRARSREILFLLVVICLIVLTSTTPCAELLPGQYPIPYCALLSCYCMCVCVHISNCEMLCLVRSCYQSSMMHIQLYIWYVYCICMYQAHSRPAHHSPPPTTVGPHFSHIYTCTCMVPASHSHTHIMVHFSIKVTHPLLIFWLKGLCTCTCMYMYHNNV